MKIDFLICSERSGSNLITKIIGNHSKYCGPSPTHLLRVFYPKLKTYGNLEEDENWNNLVKDVLTLFNLKIGIWNTSVNLEELINIKQRNFQSIITYIYQLEVKSLNKDNIFIKEIKTYSIFSFIKKAFINPRFIWMVRDPRDMALSWSKDPILRGDIVRATKNWKVDQENTFLLYEKYPDNILLIKYEDLISQQTIVLKKICQFLKIKFEESMTDFHNNHIIKENSNQSESWKNTGKKILSNNAKKYKKHLSQKQIQYIEYICHKEMNMFRYDLEYPLLSKLDFQKIERDMINEERYEKEEYKNVSEIEKTKREKWHRKYLEINNRTI